MVAEQIKLSVIEPISPAIEKMMEILFRPFDLGKWFIIGFCAWLAYLSQGGFNFHGFPGQSRHGDYSPQHIEHFFLSAMPLIIILISIGIVVGLVLFIVCLWLSSRGQFMFLHCVAKNKAEVKVPWYRFREQGNSLFLFRLAAGVIVIFFLVLFGVVIALLLIPYIKTNADVSAYYFDCGWSYRSFDTSFNSRYDFF